MWHTEAERMIHDECREEAWRDGFLKDDDYTQYLIEQDAYAHEFERSYDYD